MNNVENITHFCARNIHFSTSLCVFGWTARERMWWWRSANWGNIDSTQKKNINWKSFFFFSLSSTQKILLLKKKNTRKFIRPKMKEILFFFFFYFAGKKTLLFCVLVKTVFSTHFTHLSLFHGKEIHLARHMNNNFLWILLIQNSN